MVIKYMKLVSVIRPKLLLIMKLHVLIANQAIPNCHTAIEGMLEES